MPSKYEILLEKVYEINDLDKAQSVLSWDREVNMPDAGITARIQQMTTLSRLTHELSTSDEFGEMIENAADELNDADYDSNEASLIRHLRRSYEDARKLPSEFVVRASEVTGQAHGHWIKARAANDFVSFQPWLEQIVELSQEQVELYGYEDEKYDALLDKFEREMKTTDVRAVFNAVKAELVPLRQAIDERGTAVDDSIVHQHFEIEKQKQFARYAAAAIGYDFSRGHLGTVVHPFATSFGQNDARITTRWQPDFLNPALFGVLHESGHAMYEQGTHPDLARTPLARGTSLGFHESQSRMMENMVGRDRGFWQTHYPVLQAMFPAQLSGQSVETFYRAINKTQPSLIRVEADELTYNFHIILRFELEQAMLNGTLAVKDLPTAWNEKMETLLGITPATDSEGCLQDMHWSALYFGYFPTYALGNLYAAQLMETAVSQTPAITDELAQGQTTALVAWMRENVHQHGSKYTPRELIQRATGQPLTHEPFMRYVTTKFSEIYEL